MTDIELPDNVIVDTIPQQHETIVSLSNSSPVDDKKFIRRSPPIQLEWHNLEYKVKVKAPAPSNLLTAKERFKFTMSNMFKKVEKQILHPMTGYVAPGSVLAIMVSFVTHIMNGMTNYFFNF